MVASIAVIRGSWLRVTKLLSQVTKFSPQWWKTLGLDVCNRIRRRVQVDHRNAKGETFASYHPDYAEKKKNNEAAAKGTPQASFSTTPDMTLTGKTMADLKVRNESKFGVTIGWMGLHGGIVDSLHGRKNYKIINLDDSNVFADEETKAIMTAIDSELDKNIRAWASEKINIEVGK